jgi:pre-mRNA-splicing factor CWC26
MAAEGLTTGKAFKQDLELKRKRDGDRFEAAGAEAQGKGADTVYRDRKGRKLDMLSEMMRQEEIRAGKAVATAEAKYDWGTGAVTKQATLDREAELAAAAAQPFARYVRFELPSPFPRQRSSFPCLPLSPLCPSPSPERDGPVWRL